MPRLIPLTSKVVVSLVVKMIVLTGVLSAQEWTALRGPTGNGIAAPDLNLARPDVSMNIVWKKTIGSGYSSVVASGERLIVLFSEGTDDVIACLNCADGSLIWQESIGERFVGQNGSFDGPLSTPVIENDKVYGLSPRGMLLCRNMNDGTLVWQRNLIEQDNAVQPLYGFVTSPIAFGGKLIVQVGSPDHAVAAFDLESGEKLWHCGSDTVSSQSPTPMKFGESELVLAVGGKKFFGVDVHSGESQFEIEHGGGHANAVVPVVVDRNKILLTLDDSFSRCFELNNVDGKITASEKWMDRSIKNTYNIPVETTNGVVAYSTRFLTNVDPQTGEAYWKERLPGDGFVIAIGNAVLISTKQGSLHLARCDQKGYQELASLKLFDDLVWSVPAFHKGYVYQRSLGEVAKIEFVDSATASTSTDSTIEPGETFQQLLKSIASADSDAEKMSRIDEFMSAHESFPFIEGDRVHFIYRGTGDDVALASDLFGTRQEKSYDPSGRNEFVLPRCKTAHDATSQLCLSGRLQADIGSAKRRCVYQHNLRR
ncbi:MAG: PQQ-binding-like beta-propeller repeat protein [Pirellulaceae bacterium]